MILTNLSFVLGALLAFILASDAARAQEATSGSQERLTALLIAATNDFTETREPALEALAKSEAYYPLLLAIVKDDNADAGLVCGALAALAETDHHHEPEEVRRLAVVRAESPHSTPEVKVYAAEVLQAVESRPMGLTSIYMDGLKSKKVDVRSTSATRLGDMKCEQAVGDLVAALEDEHEEVRKLVIEELARIGRGDAVAPLCKIVVADSDLQEDAIWALGAIGKGGEISVPALINAIRRKDAATYDIAEALGKIIVASGMEVVPIVEELLPLLTSTEPNLRCAGAEAIAELPSKGCENAIAALIVLTQDREEEVRDAAFAALASHGAIAGSAARRLVAALEDPVNKANRPNIIYALGASKDASQIAVPALTRMLTEEDKVAEVALMALGKHGARAQPAIPQMARLLGHHDSEMRKTAAIALRQAGPAAVAALPALAKVVREDSQASVRIAAANALLAIAPINAEALRNVATVLSAKNYPLLDWLKSHPDRGGAILAAGLKHEDVGVREGAYLCLRHLGGSKLTLPALLEAIKDKHRNVRFMAAHKLVNMRGHSDVAAPVLVEFLNSDKETQSLASRLALQLLGRKALPALTAALAHAETPASLQVRVCQMLVRMDLASAATLPAVVALRTSKDNRVRAWATLAAAVMDERERQNALLRPLLKSKDPAIRSAALKQVARIAGEERIKDEATVTTLIAFLADDNASVRETAAKILTRCQLAPAHAAPLAAALKDETSRYALLSAFNYSSLPFRETTAALVGILKSDNLTQRETAGRMLANAGRPSAGPLLDVARDATVHRDGRVEALVALGQIESLPPEAGASLAEIVRSNDALLRIAAAAALARGGSADPKVLAALVEGLTSPGRFEFDYSVKQSVEVAFEKLGEKGAAAVPALIPLLKHQDFSVRECAASALASVGAGSNAAIDALVGVLIADSELAESVAGYLARSREKSLPRLITALKSKDARVVNNVCMAIGEIGRDAGPALPELKKMLSRNDASSVAAATAIVRIDPTTDGLLPVLTAALDSLDADKRSAALDALGEMNSLAAPATPQLIRLLDSDHADDAAVVIGKIGPPAAPAVPPLINKLKHEELFYHGARALAAMGPHAKDAVPLLLAQLKEERWMHGAAEALARMGPTGDDAIPVLLAMIEDESLAPQAADLLGAFGPRAAAAVPALRKLIDSEDMDLAKAAISSLGGIGSAALPAVPQLMELVETGSSHSARDAAAYAVGRLKPGGELPRLIALLSSGDTVRSNLAAAALEGYGPAASAAVEPLIKNLADSGRTSESLAVLGAIGPAAKAALPELEKRLKAANRWSQDEVERVIWKIDPARARELKLTEPELEDENE